jgi:hypothetical protein
MIRTEHQCPIVSHTQKEFRSLDISRSGDVEQSERRMAAVGRVAGRPYGGWWKPVVSDSGSWRWQDALGTSHCALRGTHGTWKLGAAISWADSAFRRGCRRSTDAAHARGGRAWIWCRTRREVKASGKPLWRRRSYAHDGALPRSRVFKQ